MALMLVNGPPGSGKSTLATALAAARDDTVALDVDQIKFALPQWRTDLASAGIEARVITLATAREHLLAGRHVVIGQYLARTPFIEQLDALCAELAAPFVHVLLRLDSETLRQRLGARAATPERPEHEHNNALVGPDDADDLMASLNEVARLRPEIVAVDASGPVDATVRALSSLLDERGR